MSERAVGAVIVHQDDFLQQPRRRLVDDAADGPLDDGQSFIQVDDHNAEGGEVLWIPFLCTSEREREVFTLNGKSKMQTF